MRAMAHVEFALAGLGDDTATVTRWEDNSVTIDTSGNDLTIAQARKLAAAILAVTEYPRLKRYKPQAAEREEVERGR